MRSKLFIFLVFVIFVCPSTYGQFSFGINGSLTSSGMSVPAENMKTGIKMGLFADYTFSNRIVLISGLDYVIKGANGLRSNVNYSPQMKIFDIQLGYIQLPVSIGYKINLKDNFSIVPSVGFYCAYGVHGNSKVQSFSFDAEGADKYIENSWNPYKKTVCNDWGKTTLTALDRFDMGLTFGLQADFNKILCKINYDRGFILGWNGFGNIKDVRNKSISVGFGFRF
ncbi:MAG: PorT family protein [Tannerellaceae bacterium]|jgi:hypothetical protein|nr:PorT family protein [Tannerellaceae bacterium]